MEHPGPAKPIVIRLLLYYGTIVLVLAAIALWWPGLMDFLPFGGLGEPFGSFTTPVSSGNLDEEILASYHPIDDFAGAIQLFMALTGTILMMLPIRWIYTERCIEGYRRGIAANLILLPLVVTGIIAIVQNSIALAFSLAGIVAGVSYRIRLKYASDALYIFFSIGIGLAAGTQSMGIALVMSFFFAFAVIVIPPEDLEHHEVEPHPDDED